MRSFFKKTLPFFVKTKFCTNKTINLISQKIYNAIHARHSNIIIVIGLKRTFKTDSVKECLTLFSKEESDNTLCIDVINDSINNFTFAEFLEQISGEKFKICVIDNFNLYTQHGLFFKYFYSRQDVTWIVIFSNIYTCELLAKRLPEIKFNKIYVRHLYESIILRKYDDIDSFFTYISNELLNKIADIKERIDMDIVESLVNFDDSKNYECYENFIEEDRSLFPCGKLIELEALNYFMENFCTKKYLSKIIQDIDGLTKKIINSFVIKYNYNNLYDVIYDHLVFNVDRMISDKEKDYLIKMLIDIGFFVPYVVKCESKNNLLKTRYTFSDTYYRFFIIYSNATRTLKYLYNFIKFDIEQLLYELQQNIAYFVLLENEIIKNRDYYMIENGDAFHQRLNISKTLKIIDSEYLITYTLND